MSDGVEHCGTKRVREDPMPVDSPGHFEEDEGPLFSVCPHCATLFELGSDGFIGDYEDAKAVAEGMSDDICLDGDLAPEREELPDSRPDLFRQ